MKNSIGGEFEIDPCQLISISNRKAEPTDGFWYASGRSALYYTISHAKNHYDTARVLLPEWLCRSMVDAVNMAQVEMAFYKLDRNFLPDLNCLKVEENDLIVIINYFGLQNIESAIEQIKVAYPTVPIASDLVQAYFEMEKSSIADYRYTSLRKTFAIPDGGWVLSHHNDIERVAIKNRFSKHKLYGSTLKFESLKGNLSDDTQFLDQFNRGEEMISSCDQIKATISEITLPLFEAQNLEQIAHVRRQNASYIIDELCKIGVTPLIKATTNDNVPLFVPIKIENRDRIRKALQAEGIFCPVHWPQVEGAKLSEIMAHQELSVVVDQRYTVVEMEKIIEVIKQWI